MPGQVRDLEEPDRRHEEEEEHPLQRPSLPAQERPEQLRPGRLNAFSYARSVVGTDPADGRAGIGRRCRAVDLSASSNWSTSPWPWTALLTMVNVVPQEL